MKQKQTLQIHNKMLRNGTYGQLEDLTTKSYGWLDPTMSCSPNFF